MRFDVFNPDLDKHRERMLARSRRASKGDFKRPNEFLGKEFVSRGRKLLDLGLDVEGHRLKSRRADALGRTPFGGAWGSYGRSLHYGHDGRDLKYFSTHPGADVAYSGKTVTPKKSKFLTIPFEAEGGVASPTTSSGGFARAGLSMDGKRGGARARHYKNTFFQEIGGMLWLLQKDKGSKRLRFLFYLIRSARHNVNKWAGITSKSIGGVGAGTDLVRDVYGRWVMEGRVA